MIVFPAIDLYEGKAVRLYQGDYGKMTVYSDRPAEIAADFKACGATCVHLVDLEGAKKGNTPNFETVCEIRTKSGLFCEIGGGIRAMSTVEKYVSAGLDRVILGTAAVRDPGFLREAVSAFGGKIAVGVDIRDGFVAVSGWQEKTELEAFAFCESMRDAGVSTLICTDISKDGAMRGTNLLLYQALSEKFELQITASGGVSSLEDVAALARMKLYGAIIGKAYYTGAVDLRRAIEVASGDYETDHSLS